MKKSVLLMAGVCLLSGMTAFADPVTSVNAVGVTKLNLPAGFSMIACPFNAVGAAQGMTLDQLFGSSLADYSYVYVYVPGSGYVSYVSFGGAWYNAETEEPAGDQAVLRGEGFWVYCPGAISVSLSGEVPSASIGTNRVDLLPGFQMVSFAFPQEMNIADSGIVPSDYDTIYKYNGGYVQYLFFAGSWYDVDENPVSIVLQPNEGFWYLSVSGTTNAWSQVKTYPWP